jgi:hypothetical protein
MNLNIERSFLLCLCALWLAACGTSGSDSSATNVTNAGGLSTGSTNTANGGCTDRSSAVGIEGGGIRRVLGVITSIDGDGTLVVGCGISAADAVVTVENEAGTLGDLHVGQAVEVFGSTNPESGEIRAERINAVAADHPVSLIRSGSLRDSRFLPGFQWGGTFGSVTVDKEAGSAADIHLGDVVILRGDETVSPVAVDQRGDATELLHVVGGTIDGLDLQHNQLEVMGQPVTFAFLSRFPRNGLLELTPDAEALAQLLRQVKIGDRVTVSGHGSRSGEILATRIDPQRATQPYLVTGFVSTLDTARFRFTLNKLTIDYSSAQLEEFPDGAPGIADRVVAFADHAPADGVLNASRMIYLSGAIDGPAGVDVSMEGVITRVGSATDFDIDGHSIKLKRDAICGSASSLQPQIDRWVGLYGGVLRSDGIVTDSDLGACLWAEGLLGDVSLTGPIEATSPAGLTVLGFEVTHSPVLTSWSVAGASGSAGPGSLQSDDVVNVEGSPGLSERSLMASAIVVPMQGDSETGYIDTRIFELNSPAIVIAGRRIMTTRSTIFVSADGARRKQFFKSLYVRCHKTPRTLTLFTSD